MITSRMGNRHGRSVGGSLLVEAVSALAMLSPVFLVMIFVVIEASQAYVIGTAMTQGAGLAARALADYYQTNPEVVYSSSEQQAVFTNIRIAGMISSNAQFSIPPGGWNLTATPPHVTVVCSYLPGQGSPTLGSYPSIDPLALGTRFVVSSSATYSLYQ